MASERGAGEGKYGSVAKARAQQRGAGRGTSTRMLRTTAVRLVLILAHWSCPLAHLRPCRASAHIALCRAAPGTGEALGCARVRKEDVPLAFRRQFQLRRTAILAHEKLCARRGALGDEATHQHRNQQAAADSDQPEHLRTQCQRHACTTRTVHALHIQAGSKRCGPVDRWTGLSSADTRPRAHGARLSSSNRTAIVRSCEGWALGLLMQPRPARSRI